MKTLVILFTDGFVMIKKVAKDLENAVLIKELREDGYGNIEKIVEAK